MSSTIVVVLLLAGRAAGQVLTTLQPSRFPKSFTDVHLADALPFFIVLAFTIQFVLQMNRMIGANVLRYFATGSDHRPRKEERVGSSASWTT